MALLGKNPSRDQWLSCSNYVDEPQTNQYQEAPPALSNPPYRCGVEKDGKGHIERKVEIVDGERTVTEYGYDAASRLVRVGVNGRQTEEYRYDDKGRRVYARLLQTSHGEAGRYPSGQSFKYRAGDRLGGVGLGLKLEYDHKGRTVHYHVGGPELSYNAVDIEYAELPGLQDMQTMLDLPMRLTYTEPRPEALRQKRAKFATDPRYGDKQTKSGLVESKRMTEKVVTYTYDKSAMRRSKMVDEQTVAHYAWLDPFRLEAIHAPWSKALVHFHYADNVRLPYAATSGSTVLYLFYDHIGSLRVVANSNGDIVRKIEYESFGYIVHDTNPGLHLGYGFAGGLHDQDTGFVRFWVRDYDPKLGRFLSPDPAWAGEMTNQKAEGKARASAEVGKQVVDPDRYGYCLDDPINLVDRSGLSARMDSQLDDHSKMITSLDDRAMMRTENAGSKVVGDKSEADTEEDGGNWSNMVQALGDEATFLNQYAVRNGVYGKVLGSALGWLSFGVGFLMDYKKLADSTLSGNGIDLHDEENQDFDAMGGNPQYFDFDADEGNNNTEKLGRPSVNEDFDALNVSTSFNFDGDEDDSNSGSSSSGNSSSARGGSAESSRDSPYGR